jgi:hypothetical protein
VKEMTGDLGRFLVGLPGALVHADAYAAVRPLFKLGLHLGDVVGWLRWRLGRRSGVEALGYLPARPDDVREAV